MSLLFIINYHGVWSCDHRFTTDKDKCIFIGNELGGRANVKYKKGL